MTAGAILESVLNPFTECLTREAARRITGFRVDTETQERVNQLADLVCSGKITEEQEQEYRELVEAFDLVAILKSRARAVILGGG